MIEATVRGLDQIQRRIAGADDVLEREVDRARYSLLDDARDMASAYPPERPGQVYVRTGDLGEAWQTALPLTSRSGSTTITRLQNPLAYAPIVQDAVDQADIHHGRWDTTAQIMRDLQPLADAEAERAAAVVARELGGT